MWASLKVLGVLTIDCRHSGSDGAGGVPSTTTQWGPILITATTLGNKQWGIMASFQVQYRTLLGRFGVTAPFLTQEWLQC